MHNYLFNQIVYTFYVDIYVNSTLQQSENSNLVSYDNKGVLGCTN